MKERRFRAHFILGVLCAAAVSSIAGAWGPEGHRITGDIATAYLSDEAKRAIRDILGNQSLADVSNWADEARETEEYGWTRPLHYVNVPRAATNVNMERDCENGMCVVGAVREYERTLRDPSASAKERRDALRFLVHFIGDIHQPMHVSYRDDLGGNRIDVTLFGEGTNLHRAWDTGLIRAHMGDRRLRDVTDEIREAITPEMAQRWVRTLDPVVWANESLAITRRIYRELPRDGALGQEYYERNIGDVLERLAMAGVRMAAMLNDIFKREAEPSPDEPDDAKEPQENPALIALSIVKGDECGREGGRMMFLHNGDETRLIEARVRQSWRDRGREMSTERTIVVRPGEANRQRLGCSHQSAAGQLREFSWEIIDARFR